jgi:hypothetical protein
MVEGAEPARSGAGASRRTPTRAVPGLIPTRADTARSSMPTKQRRPLSKRDAACGAPPVVRTAAANYFDGVVVAKFRLDETQAL